jgi:hypothetical protein
MNRGQKLTPKIIAELAAGYKAGKNLDELAVMFNMSKATVSRGLDKIGIDAERRDNLFTPVEVPDEIEQTICADYKTGQFNPLELSKKYALGVAVINRVLVKHGVVAKKRRYYKALTPKETVTVKVGATMTKKLLSETEQLELCAKYEDGPKTKLELASEYQINPDTVSAILRRHNTILKKYLPEDLSAQMCEDFKAGLEILDLAEIYNQDPEVVLYNLTKHNLIGKMEPGTSLEVTSESPKTLSPGALRKLAKDSSPEMMDILKSLARNPLVNPRTRATCAQIILDRGYGKSREEAEEEVQAQSSTERILKLVSNTANVFKKKA